MSINPNLYIYPFQSHSLHLLPLNRKYNNQRQLAQYRIAGTSINLNIKNGRFYEIVMLTQAEDQDEIQQSYWTFTDKKKAFEEFYKHCERFDAEDMYDDLPDSSQDKITHIERRSA